MFNVLTVKLFYITVMYDKRNKLKAVGKLMNK